MLDSAGQPLDVHSALIGDLIEGVATRNPAISAPNDAFTYIDLSAIDQEAKAITNAHSILGKEAPSRARQVVHSGDILVSTVRPNLNGVARVLDAHDRSIASTGFCVLRPRRERLDASFLFHWVKTPMFVESMIRQATGASYPAVSDAIIRRSPIPCPSIAEQRRIAAILDQADALRAKRRAALAQLDELAPAIFMEMFGDSCAWAERWLSRDFAATMCDETSQSKKLLQSDFLPVGKYPVVDQGQPEIAGYCDDVQMLCTSKRPCIVFGDHTRAVKIVYENFVVGADGAEVLVPRAGIDPLFLSFVLRLAPIPNLGYSRHMREVKRMSFPAPPIALQRVFAKRIALLEIERRTQRLSASRLDSLFASLQHRAFRGDL